MKYSARNPPLVCMQTNSTCYRGTHKMEVKGVLWHSTGANNPWLKRYVQPGENDPNYADLLDALGRNANRNDWNHIERQAGLNAWVGKLANGHLAAVQTMPWNFRPWGCGSGPKGSCNSGWIQFEICEDGLTDPDYFRAAYREAVELTAYLCRMFGIDPRGKVKVNGVNVPTILCHWDSYLLGMGGGHSDVYHWFKRHGKDMNSVRADVAALLEDKEEDEMTYYKTLDDVPEWYEPTIRKLVEKHALQGVDEKGTLNISQDMCRILTLLDRKGVLG